MAETIPKADTSNLVNWLAIAGFKVIEEKILAPFVGNSDFKSGGIKIGLSILTKKIVPNNKWLNYMALALFIDGVEDIAYNGLKYMPSVQGINPIQGENKVLTVWGGENGEI